MCRLLILAVILCFIQFNSVFGEIDKESVDSQINLITLKNATEYFKEKSINDYLRFNKTILDRTRIRYTLGRRLSTDRLVASNSQSQQWNQLQDVTLNLTYPRFGTGAVVTFVDINVDQSTNLGQAYVTSGGVGQRRITIIIEAYRTQYFRHVSQIFGY